MSVTLSSRRAATPSKNKQDFWLLYNTPVGGEGVLADALCALYYLPEHFKLASTNTSLSPAVSRRHSDIMSRIHTKENKTEAPQAAPFIFIHNSVDEARMSHQKPSIVLTKNPEKEMKHHERGGFVVSRNQPEALASAVLNIARPVAFSEG